MHTGLRITAYAAALAATFGTAYGVGHGIGPVVDDEPPARHEAHRAGGDQEHPGDRGSAGHSGHAEEGSPPAGGLQISESGYTLDLRTPRLAAGRTTDLRFTIRGDDGRAVTAFRTEHDKELHLIVASRDLNTYRHLHPTRAADGTWSILVALPRAGGYRVFADFTPEKKGAENLTLGADLAVSGAYEPRPVPAPDTTAETDGYQVKLAGTLRPGTARALTPTVWRDGRPVTDLQPYLGAYGHLVALRSGDLAYLHVHPNGEPGDGTTDPGPAVTFTATAPSAGTYRLFLDFKHEGKVHTAAFTVRAAGAAGETSAETPHEPSGGARPLSATADGGAAADGERGP